MGRLKATAERFARRWWAGELGAAGRALSVLAAPASWTWSALHTLRRRAVGEASGIPGLRVVSVGNLAVGGTGKTPLVRWVTSALLARGAAPAVLVGEAGADEAELHRRWNPGVEVLVDRDRVSSARRARAAGCSVAVIDDGFHYAPLARDLDLVLISADDPFPAPVLPRGPYREPASALGRAAAVVVTRRAAPAERAEAVAAVIGREWPRHVIGIVALEAGAFIRLDGITPAPAPAGDVLAVAGVARPDAFAASLRGVVKGDVELMAFGDHHPYDQADAERIRRRANGRAVVTTEKDAVKLGRWREELGETFVLQDQLRWERGESALRTLLLAAVVEKEGT
jgi:tetraacyldisaccharide 4'-kinase